MPCTPTAGLSRSYISQWTHLTQHSPSLDVPSLDPISSPARGRVPMRKSRDDAFDDEECYTPRARRRSAHSPAPLAPVSSRGSIANVGRARVARYARHPAAPPMPTNPTLNFIRLAHKPPVEAKLGAEHRIPSDVTNRVISHERAATTPSPDLIFNMSPVLGLECPSRPYRVASRLSGEPDVAGDGDFDVPVERVEELHISESKPSRDSPFLYSYTLPETQYESSAFSTSRETSDREEDGLSSASATTSALVDDLPCLIEPPRMPRLGRMHAKSDPLPTRLSSASTSSRAQPIPIPKPSPRVLSDYGGVNASLVPSAPVPAPRWAKTPVSGARLERRLRREAEHQQQKSQSQDVTDEWCGTADAVPVASQAPVPVPTKRKKRFYIAGVGESYDGDMDSELSSWQ